MKRKVIQIADSTMLVSLPRPWAKKNNLKKGDEVDVIVDKNIVQITADSKIEIKSITVDLSGKFELIEKTIGAIYRAGYDEVKLQYTTNEEHRKIHEIMGNNVIGLEIVDERKGVVIAKSVSSIDSKEFDSMLRRGFLFLLSMSEDSLEFYKNEKYDDLMGVALRDNNINKISDFCRRTLNKQGHKDYPHTSTIYSISMSIERLGDMYKDISSYCSSEKIKHDKKIYEMFSDVNKIVRSYYECFYNFNLDGVWNIMSKKKEISVKLDKLIMETDKKNIRIVQILRNLASYSSEMTGVLMVNFL